MAVHLPLQPVTNAVQTITNITGGTEYITRFSTIDAAGQHHSVVHQLSEIGNSWNAAITFSEYGINAATVNQNFNSSTDLSSWVTVSGAFNNDYTQGYIQANQFDSTDNIAWMYNTAAQNVFASTKNYDYQVSVTFGTYGGALGGSAGPVVRANTSGDQFYCAKVTGTASYVLEKVNNGTVTVLASGSPSVQLVPGGVVTLSAIGSTITLFINGVIYATVVDTSFSTGVAGLMSWSNYPSRARTPVITNCTISQVALLGEETIYANANYGTVDSQGRLPVAAELSTDASANSNTYLLSGGSNPAAGQTTANTIINAWLQAKGVL